MVKLISIFSLVLIGFNVFAQNEYEALLFSHYTPNGTARYNAMGGAFGALGADLSVMATNPAGIAMYRKSELGISTAWTNYNIESSYNGSIKNTNEMSFQMANLGFVTVNGTNNADWKKINVGFAYNHLNDYNKSYVIKGDNYESSMLDLQAHFLNLNNNDTLYNSYFKAMLLFNEGGDYFYNDFNAGGNYYGAKQVHKVKTEGYAGEYDLSVSSSYRDFMFVGATLGFQRLKYSSYVEHSETPYSNEIVLVDFQSQDYLDVKGSGFNLKLGVLLKLSQMLRIGAAFHTPTMYNIKYTYFTDVYSTLNFGTGNFESNGFSPEGNYNWSFTSPAKYILSGAFVLGKSAIISADVEYLNYGKLKMSSDDNLFEFENDNIKNIYKSTVNARLGAEYRLGMLSLRAGLAYLDSPYASGEQNDDAYKVLYSGGIGVNSGAVYFDVSYQYMASKESYYMYRYETSKADLTNTSNKFITTLGFRF